MKFGIVSAILDKLLFEDMIDMVSEMGFECVEIACWPDEKAERRYAGVNHIDADTLNLMQAEYILNYCKKRQIIISALAFYPNMMDEDLQKRKKNIEHLYKVIDASAMLNINLVTTFIGRIQTKCIEENLNTVAEIWPPIMRYAEKKNVRIAIENCPMLFGRDQWPGGQNLMTTPDTWNKVFDIVGSDNLGINYDPSHFIWQMMDYIQPIYIFKDRIFHVHFKDIKLFKDKLKRVGTMAYPLEYMMPKIPGLGDVDWGCYVSALTDIGYKGYACLEVEDKAFENSDEMVLKSIRLAKKYLEQFVI